jgi:3-oxoacyl-[acyl-carrier protein] reductase
VSRDTILITGASSDIGLALMRRLAGGAEPPVILAHGCSGIARIAELRDALESASIYPLEADFRKEACVGGLAEEISRTFGPPTQFVHIPALKLVYERFTKFAWDHFQTDLNIQLRSAVILLQRFLPAMARLPRAKVVFLLSSVTRGVPPKFMSMYTVVKHAQLGLMRALASEYADTGLCVNAVSPGMVDTRFLDDIPEMAKEMSAAASPRKRNVQPSEVVDAIEFLLSPKANLITGIELPVTGGAAY